MTTEVMASYTALMPEGDSRVRDQEQTTEKLVSLRVDVIFDTVCPWCYIGKRRLEAAFRLRPELAPRVRWRPFMLNPDMPPEGVDRTAYLAAKFGNEGRIGRVQAAIVDAGHQEQIPFAFDRIRRTPNSVDSHRLIQFADATGVAGPVAEAVFSAYFVEGLDIGDRDVLVAIGVDHGLDAGSLDRYLSSSDDVSRIRLDNAAYHRLGINGVPAFIFGDAFVVSGAQEATILARAFDAAATLSIPA
jgi:predicted DsbA family dithiol-disulfide isomerase